MGKQPTVLIIARHGTRLDQADKRWTDTAEKPWDPPLSYGGWIQSQSLGARIAAELQRLDTIPVTDDATKDTLPANSRPAKRRKIVIHSSPYLRCIQTSTGIAAGLRSQETVRLRPIPTPHQRSSPSQASVSIGNSSSMRLPEDARRQSNTINSRNESNGIDLKVDAWLGEWLSSGYFEESKIPPPSKELVQSAKYYLSNAPEEIYGADIANTSITEFDENGAAEQASDSKPVSTQEKTGLRAMAALGHSLPRRPRNVSANQSINGTASLNSEPASRRLRNSTYSPPIPTYALSPQEPIPIGFVAHARDACVDIDFDWDSQNPPLAWGDGGQYEEEWSTMHRRFLNGLQSTLSYYETNNLCDEDAMDVDQTEDDDDIVVILVTHQAGANALIRLVTGAPALHDVGTASLTLAVRKPGLTRKQSAQSSTSPRRRGSLDMGINDDFDMKIIASTEHLRTGSNPLGLNSPRLGMSPAMAGRRMVGPDSAEGFSIGDPLAWRSSSQSNIGRSSSFTRKHASDSSTSVATNGPSLWSGRTTRVNSASSEMGWDPRFSNTTLHLGRVSNNVILEDEAIENWAASGADPRTSYTNSPSMIESQSIWEPDSGWKPRAPVRSGSTHLTNNPATGLWGSPVTNPGGVKEGTPHSRGSFGTDDAPLPTWGPRVNRNPERSNLRNETQQD